MSAATATALGATQSKPRVLVIDDDEVARQTIIELLERGGYKVTGLPSPIGATKRIIKDGIDVVVLDVMMPSIRGDKLAALLSRNPRLGHLGVVLVTGAPISELTGVADAVKATAVVRKTEIHSELERAVRAAAQRSMSRRLSGA